jgi:hypothetical protein
LQIDVFLVNSSDPRLAWTVVSMAFNLTSTRGWTAAAVAEAIGVSESTLARSKARFEKLIGFNTGAAHLLPCDKSVGNQ